MILKLQVVVIGDDGQQETCEITSVERKDLNPATLGLTLAEGKAILKGIQEIVIQRQAALSLETYRQCPDCGASRTGNGYHDLSVRTVFGHPTRAPARWLLANRRGFRHRPLCAHRKYEHRPRQRRRVQVRQKSVGAHASNRTEFACRSKRYPKDSCSYSVHH